MVIFLFSSLHNIPSWVYGLVGHCWFLPVCIFTRTVNQMQCKDCDVVKWGASAAKRPHNHVLVVC